MSALAVAGEPEVVEYGVWERQQREHEAIGVREFSVIGSELSFVLMVDAVYSEVVAASVHIAVEEPEPEPDEEERCPYHGHCRLESIIVEGVMLWGAYGQLEAIEPSEELWLAMEKIAARRSDQLARRRGR